MVGKVDAPPKANMILPKALKYPSAVGSGNSRSNVEELYETLNVQLMMVLLEVTSSRIWMEARTQAVMVVNNAPTAMGLREHRK